MKHRWRAWSTLALAACIGCAVPISWADPSPGHFADAQDRALVSEGKSLYMRYCASCHGRKLQGQPLWQLESPDGRRRAPAQDETGHTWQHSDEDIFQMTKFGRFAGTPATAVSAMPAFESVMSEGEILAVMAFIKARWPLGLRASQSMLNPGFVGMPTSASETDWTFPPTCVAIGQGVPQAPRDPTSARTPR